MEIKNENAKIFKNSLFLIFAFIPILNSFAFFYVGKHSKMKKYTILGCTTIILQIILTFLSLQMFKFIFPDSVMRVITSLYMILNVHSEPQVTLISFYSEIIVYIIIFITVFVNRKKYVKMFNNKNNRRNIKSRLEADNHNASGNIETIVKSDKKIIDFVDINTASEDEIATIPGITIIDAKKAVAYREEHIGFGSKHEFFRIINAKPHIIARAEEFILVGEVKQTKKNSEANGKRKIDIL